MTTIRHESAENTLPELDRLLLEVLLNAKSTKRTFRVCTCAANLSHRATEGTAAGEGSPGETSMYHFSRSIYRELAPDIIEDRPEHDGTTNHERVLRSCETLRRASRHGLALLRQADQDAVQRHPDLLPDVGAAARLQDRRSLHVLRARVLRREPGRRAARMPRDHPPGDAVPANTAAAQRLLPLASAPRRDRGHSSNSPPDASVHARCCWAWTWAGPSRTPCWPSAAAWSRRRRRRPLRTSPKAS